MGKKKDAKKGTLAVGFCLDESGSMGRVADQTISGVNEFIGGLRKDGDTTLTLTMFSSDRYDRFALTSRRLGVTQTYRPYCSRADVNDVALLTPMTYSPDGNTPLFDAIGSTIRTLQQELDARPVQPDAVMFVIQTDGLENASMEFTRESIVALITEKERAGWKFIFLGANMDEAAAHRASAVMGMSVGSSMSYDYGQTGATFAGVTAASSSLRSDPSMDSAQMTNVARGHRDREESKKP